MIRSLCELPIELYHTGSISREKFINGMLLGPRGALELTEELLKKRMISYERYQTVYKAITRELKIQLGAKEKAEVAKSKKMLREIDSMYGRSGSPVAQGGLPSLGKKG